MSSTKCFNQHNSLMNRRVFQEGCHSLVETIRPVRLKASYCFDLYCWEFGLNQRSLAEGKSKAQKHIAQGNALGFMML